MIELAEEPYIDKGDAKEHNNIIEDEEHDGVLKKSYNCLIKSFYSLYAVGVASVMCFLAGTTMSFSSFLLDEVSKLQNPQLRFSTGLEGIFGVSKSGNRLVSINEIL